MKRYLHHVFSGETHRPNGYRYSYLKVHEAMEMMGVALVRDAKHALIHSIPGTIPTVADGQVQSLLTMWETDTLPDAFKINLKRFLKVFVPTEWSRALMEPYANEVVVAPLGVDPTVFYPRHGRDFETPFTVLTFGHGRRKGIDELLRAWEMADLPDDARLIIKNDERGPRWPSIRGVEHIRQTVSDDDLRRLYWNSDLYISCSYGEGFDLPAFQAIACGVPTIVPNHTAYTHYSNYAMHLLDAGTKAPANMEVFGPSGNWVRPKVAEVASALETAAAHRRDWVAPARARGGELAANNDWALTATTILEAFGEDLLPMTPGQDVQVEFTMPVRALRDLPGYDVGGRKGSLQTGERYTLTLDAARVLSAAGYVEVEDG